ncbi:hypothetical protein KIPB_000731 [Kipferlia bialata]|uniref:Uncharacterized protein n=1 Tax=Kipferlia bialata TaxID=797122 RepID=A0A9K3CMV7_9EUKA|nr:hypothetical protein KIPB_000731 [Kipferlia bialata]|eukprot:g731.t1
MERGTALDTFRKELLLSCVAKSPSSRGSSPVVSTPARISSLLHAGRVDDVLTLLMQSRGEDATVPVANILDTETLPPPLTLPLLFSLRLIEVQLKAVHGDTAGAACLAQGQLAECVLRDTRQPTGIGDMHRQGVARYLIHPGARGDDQYQRTVLLHSLRTRICDVLEECLKLMGVPRSPSQGMVPLPALSADVLFKHCLSIHAEAVELGYASQIHKPGQRFHIKGLSVPESVRAHAVSQSRDSQSRDEPHRGRHTHPHPHPNRHDAIVPRGSGGWDQEGGTGHSPPPPTPATEVSSFELRDLFSVLTSRVPPTHDVEVPPLNKWFIPYPKYVDAIRAGANIPSVRCARNILKSCAPESPSDRARPYPLSPSVLSDMGANTRWMVQALQAGLDTVALRDDAMRVVCGSRGEGDTGMDTGHTETGARGIGSLPLGGMDTSVTHHAPDGDTSDAEAVPGGDAADALPVPHLRRDRMVCVLRACVAALHSVQQRVDGMARVRGKESPGVAGTDTAMSAERAQAFADITPGLPESPSPSLSFQREGDVVCRKVHGPVSGSERHTPHTPSLDVALLAVDTVLSLFQYSASTLSLCPGVPATRVFSDFASLSVALLPLIQLSQARRSPIVDMVHPYSGGSGAISGRKVSSESRAGPKQSSTAMAPSAAGTPTGTLPPDPSLPHPASYGHVLSETAVSLESNRHSTLEGWASPLPDETPYIATALAMVNGPNGREVLGCLYTQALGHVLLLGLYCTLCMAGQTDRAVHVAQTAILPVIHRARGCLDPSVLCGLAAQAEIDTLMTSARGGFRESGTTPDQHQRERSASRSVYGGDARKGRVPPGVRGVRLDGDIVGYVLNQLLCIPAALFRVSDTHPLLPEARTCLSAVCICASRLAYLASLSALFQGEVPTSSVRAKRRVTPRRRHRRRQRVSSEGAGGVATGESASKPLVGKTSTTSEREASHVSSAAAVSGIVSAYPTSVPSTGKGASAHRGKQRPKGQRTRRHLGKVPHSIVGSTVGPQVLSLSSMFQYHHHGSGTVAGWDGPTGFELVDMPALSPQAEASPKAVARGSLGHTLRSKGSDSPEEDTGAIDDVGGVDHQDVEMEGGRARVRRRGVSKVSGSEPQPSLADIRDARILDIVNAVYLPTHGGAHTSSLPLTFPVLMWELREAYAYYRAHCGRVCILHEALGLSDILGAARPPTSVRGSADSLSFHLSLPDTVPTTHAVEQTTLSQDAIDVLLCACEGSRIAAFVIEDLAACSDYLSEEEVRGRGRGSLVLAEQIRGLVTGQTDRRVGLVDRLLCGAPNPSLSQVVQRQPAIPGEPASPPALRRVRQALRDGGEVWGAGAAASTTPLTFSVPRLDSATQPQGPGGEEEGGPEASLAPLSLPLLLHWIAKGDSRNAGDVCMGLLMVALVSTSLSLSRTLASERDPSLASVAPDASLLMLQQLVPAIRGVLVTVAKLSITAARLKVPGHPLPDRSLSPPLAVLAAKVDPTHSQVACSRGFRRVVREVCCEALATLHLTSRHTPLSHSGVGVTGFYDGWSTLGSAGGGRRLPDSLGGGTRVGRGGRLTELMRGQEREARPPDSETVDTGNQMPSASPPPSESGTPSPRFSDGYSPFVRSGAPSPPSRPFTRALRSTRLGMHPLQRGTGFSEVDTTMSIAGSDLTPRLFLTPVDAPQAGEGGQQRERERSPGIPVFGSGNASPEAREGGRGVGDVRRGDVIPRPGANLSTPDSPAVLLPQYSAASDTFSESQARSYSYYSYSPSEYPTSRIHSRGEGTPSVEMSDRGSSGSASATSGEGDYVALFQLLDTSLSESESETETDTETESGTTSPEGSGGEEDSGPEELLREFSHPHHPPPPPTLDTPFPEMSASLASTVSLSSGDMVAGSLAPWTPSPVPEVLIQMRDRAIRRAQRRQQRIEREREAAEEDDQRIVTRRRRVRRPTPYPSAGMQRHPLRESYSVRENRLDVALPQVLEVADEMGLLRELGRELQRQAGDALTPGQREEVQATLDDILAQRYGGPENYEDVEEVGREGVVWAPRLRRERQRVTGAESPPGPVPMRHRHRGHRGTIPDIDLVPTVHHPEQLIEAVMTVFSIDRDLAIQLLDQYHTLEGIQAGLYGLRM